MSETLMIITRIHYRNEGVNEFAFWSNGNSMVNILIDQNALIVYPGNTIWNPEDSVLKDVNSLPTVNPSTIFIAYHGPAGMDLKPNLHEKYGINTKVKSYSLGDTPSNKTEFNTAYKPIADKVKQGVQLSQEDFELIKSFFFGDPKLETYLNLLHECLKYDQFKADNNEIVEKAKSYFMHSHIASEKWLKFINERNQENLSDLRDELLKSY